MTAPYAYSANIEHEYKSGTLKAYLTFFQAMKTHRFAYPDPDPIIIIPSDSLWSFALDGVATSITSSLWLDDFTLQITISGLSVVPAEVLVSFLRPSQELITYTGKQIEPFIDQPSTDLTALLLPVGMIVLWSGSIASIPAGWLLCDGSNGTPDLREKFILGAGTTAPGNSGGNATHNHTATQPAHNHNSFPPFGTAITGTAPVCSNNATPAITVANTTVLPPWYALAYIQKA